MKIQTNNNRYLHWKLQQETVMLFCLFRKWRFTSPFIIWLQVKPLEIKLYFVKNIDVIICTSMYV